MRTVAELKSLLEEISKCEDYVLNDDVIVDGIELLFKLVIKRRTNMILNSTEKVKRDNKGRGRMKYVDDLGAVVANEIRHVNVNHKVIDIIYYGKIKGDKKFVVVFENGFVSAYTRNGIGVDNGPQCFVYKKKLSVKSMKEIFEEFPNSYFSGNGDLNIVNKEDKTIGCLMPHMFNLLDKDTVDPRLDAFLIKENN